MQEKTLSADALNARRKYYRSWYGKHPERRREYTRRYWERKAQALTAEPLPESKVDECQD